MLRCPRSGIPTYAPLHSSTPRGRRAAARHTSLATDALAADRRGRRYEGMRSDFLNALKLVRPGGVIVMDDYDWAGVKQAPIPPRPGHAAASQRAAACRLPRGASRCRVVPRRGSPIAHGLGQPRPR